ncbi:Subtilase family protein [Forsythia ovata]|uniref:Subtilase family protein n=1 Tax=Forsythia ovata TaxID=205694 RepID=A0ABD1SP03_9LAMI
MQMVYSYRHSFSGFAAKLTESQAKKIADYPEVVQVIRNRHHKVLNTRSWDFAGLSARVPDNLLHESNMGDGIIIGVIDSGILPNPAFKDEGLGPIPARWQGECESVDMFDASKQCNNKVIGARFYKDGFEMEFQGNLTDYFTYSDNPSPLDIVGHGSHVASTAAGSFVANATYFGHNFGTFRGGAPRARLAVYKACWYEPTLETQSCTDADVLQAFEDASHDGVDIISLSIGPTMPLISEVDKSSTLAIASFHAVADGIPVVCAAGNEGPVGATVTNVSPWILTVAASNVDRAFQTIITLGNNKTFSGQSLMTKDGIGFKDLIFGGEYNSGPSENFRFLASDVEGRVVLCYLMKEATSNVAAYARAVNASGAAAMIVAMPPDDITIYPFYTGNYSLAGVPVIQVDYETGTEILNYCLTSEATPLIKLSSTKILVGKPVAAKVAAYSSRGPNSYVPSVLKPDIAAPGTSILAVSANSDSMTDNAYSLDSGTSMATPHVTGIVALLRALHPDWSPAAIKSALVTTAWNTDTYDYPIFAEGNSRKLADPFDYGGGIANPNGAAHPGLVYDMGRNDYIHYLCSLGYSNGLIYNATSDSPEIQNVAGIRGMCPKPIMSILDLNLPSITIPNLREKVTVTRTVTNVGLPVKTVYKAVIKSPLGTKVSVKPKVLSFDYGIKKISFQVTIKSTKKYNLGYTFGSLTWTDGKHSVRSPISVKTEIKFRTSGIKNETLKKDFQRDEMRLLASKQGFIST